MSYLMHLTRSEPSYPIKHAPVQPCNGKPRKDVQRELYFCVFILRHPLDFSLLTHFPAPVLRDAAESCIWLGERTAPRYSLVTCPQCPSTSWSYVFMTTTPVQAGAERPFPFGGWKLRNSGAAPQGWWTPLMAEAQLTGQGTWENYGGEPEPWGRHWNLFSPSIKSCPLAFRSIMRNTPWVGSNWFFTGEAENKPRWWGHGGSETGESFWPSPGLSKEELRCQ